MNWKMPSSLEEWIDAPIFDKLVSMSYRMKEKARLRNLPHVRSVVEGAIAHAASAHVMTCGTAILEEYARRWCSAAAWAQFPEEEDDRTLAESKYMEEVADLAYVSEATERVLRAMTDFLKAFHGEHTNGECDYGELACAYAAAAQHLPEEIKRRGETRILDKCDVFLGEWLEGSTKEYPQ
jgi:hypothetical protein